MLTEKEITRLSKLLSLVLRHQPEVIGIELDENGWTDVNQLLKKLDEAQSAIDFEQLKYIVETNNKKRFAFNDTSTKIRASQGHSVGIELGYSPQQPPALLYHGTAEKNIDSILATGLNKGQRTHVHLTTDPDTAKTVGRRYGKPVIFEVDTNAMAQNGFLFYQSENNVWLTDNVPPAYLKIRKTS